MPDKKQHSLICLWPGVLLILFFTTNCFAQQQPPPGKIYPYPKGKRWILVTKERLPVSDQEYDFIGKFSNDRAVVKRDGFEGYIDTAGKEVIPPRFDEALPFTRNRAIVKLGGQQTIINMQGAVISGQWYDSVFPQQEGIFMVRVLHTDGLYRKLPVVRAQTHAKIKMTADSILVPDVLTGYVTSSEGKLVGDYLFTGGDSFEGGRAKVAIGYYTMYLYPNGKLTKRPPDECDEALLTIVPRPDNFKTFQNNLNQLIEQIKDNWEFPFDSVHLQLGMQVHVSFVINTKGKIIRPVIVEPSKKSFAETLLKAIREAPPTLPAVCNGQPVCRKINYKGTFIVVAPN